MSDSEVITATEASRAFSDMLHKVAYQGHSYVIKKGSRMMAKIVPMEETEAAPKKSAKKANTPKAAPVIAAPVQPVSKPVERKVETVSVQEPAPVAFNPMPPVSVPATLDMPENFTQEDVDFYQDLIANMGSR